jgi:two-component system cell cycle sensor histidine kinase/response regulator CckA
VDQLLRQEIKDPQSPSPEEVHRLVYELELRQSELERENGELRTTKRHLEAYRDRYVDLYDFAPLGYATLDQDGYVQEVNLAGAGMLGAERDALTGHAFADYVAKGDQKAFLDHVRQCAVERRDVTSELRLVGEGGQSIAVQLHSIPIEGPKEETFCKTAITDITERKRMEEALQQDRNLLRTLIDNLPDFIYVKDTESRFAAANLAVTRIMGAATPSDLLGKTDADFYPPELAAEYRADEEKLLRSGEPLINKDEPHLDAGGNPRAVLTTKVPLKDNGGKVFGLVGISRDITERKQAEQTLRQAHEELLEHQRQLRHQVEAELAKAKDQLVRQARLAAIGRIAASVVHDLRNSLFVMSNATFLLKGCTSPDDPQCRQYIDHICQEIDATKRLAANLMEMARVKQPQKEKVDLGQAAREVFDPLQHGRSISFQMEFDRQPFVVAADPLQLRQVLGNLLANAVQATPDGGHVRLRASRGGGVDTIVVEDDGAGVSAELRDQLFEPLVSTKPKGTGLGLAICRQIVEEHRGSIELLPGGGRGTAFQIRLPAAETG